MNDSHVSLLACPDCHGVLGSFGGGGDESGLSCEVCALVFPVTDGIPILLPRHARSKEVELPLVEALAAREGTDAVRPALDATLELLRSLDGKKSWEWEDEEYWRKKYRGQMERVRAGEDLDKGRWPVRFWQREFLVERMPDALWDQGKTILDIGCGAGHNFRILLSSKFHDDSLYIAADVSLDALKLNRLRNPHANGLYVLCSADRVPFRDGVVDMLCYFGILHHTERKAGTIEEDSRLLKNGGVAVLHEAISRKSARPSFLPIEDAGSEHEETIDRGDLLEAIRRAPGLEIRAEWWGHTAIMGLGKMVLRRWVRSRSAYTMVSAIDVFFMKMLGGFWSHFAPAEALILLSKDDAAPSTSQTPSTA